MRTLKVATPGSTALWVVVLLLAGVFGEAIENLVPAAHLLGPLLAGLVCAVTGAMVRPAPAAANRISQALLGVLMGSYLQPQALVHISGKIVPLTLVTAATVVLGLLAALLLVRLGGMDRASATLGMMAGGSAAVVACADELRADSRLVTFMQYLRVALVAASAPFLVGWIDPAAHHHAPVAENGVAAAGHQVVSGTHQLAGLAALAAIAVLGAQAGTRLRLPCPALLGPMLLAAFATAIGAAHGFAPTGPLRALLFTIIGLDVGLRFSRRDLAHVRRLLPLVLAATTLITLACAALAWVLAAATGIPRADAYLATTPGGINAVLATAASTGGDLPLISGVQSLRLFLMVLLAPLLIRLLARFQSSGERGERTSCGARGDCGTDSGGPR
ncbi:AbrB family transcriptional regulator [Actinomadura barringtoniae]|uniref:AbrB family transcriptional regulator n=1 Tax=Actinomadura barringtoniae TaxID=1427535 RepID=A0A939TDV8_9ACTN|nr:AbrB family transcriptional regulator [Actinomadura barringtoniae]MBO2452695.1 AbrB family transcriptional regulator [Actinomadura barringtoniae]